MTVVEENTARPTPLQAAEYKNPYKVMVVDDAVVIRGIISRILEQDPKVEVVATAANGEMAIKNLQQKDIEVIVLDIEMPVMDGLTAIPKLLEIKPDVQIIMASTLTLRNAEISMEALEKGAKDYLPKPSSSSELASAESFRLELIHKVKALGASNRLSHAQELPRRARERGAGAPEVAREDDTTFIRPAVEPSGTAKAVNREGSPPIPKPDQPIELRKSVLMRPAAIAIGSSTGGPQALITFFKGLKQEINVPILLTQHMPATFTSILAKNIEKTTGWPCVEATEGLEVKPGVVHIAPGDYHMTVIKSEEGKMVVRLNQNPPENFCRPSVDPMLHSMIEVYGPRILSVILTGMGHDGLYSCRNLVEAGGRVIAQDQKTSVVWGMPGTVAADGLCTDVLPLGKMADKVLTIVKGGQ